MSNPILTHWYENLFAYVVQRPDVEEIAINTVPANDQPTIIWVRFRNGQTAQPFIYPSDLARWLHSFTMMAANAGNQYFGQRRPFIYPSMPDGSRFVAAHGSATPHQLHDSSGLAICLRGVKQRPELLNVPFPLEAAGRHILEPSEIPHVPVPELEQLGRQLRGEGKGAIFVGDKGVGKTNAIKNVLKMFDPQWRCVVLEDQREIPPILPNTLFITVQRTSDDINRKIEDALEFSARTPAHVLVLGEVSAPLASKMSRIMEQGFRIVMTTLHGVNNERGLLKLYQDIVHGGGHMDPAAFRDFVTERFGAIVLLAEEPGTGRKVILANEKPDAVLSRIRLPGEAERKHQ